MDFYINQSLILVSCMKVLKRILQQILTFLLTSQHPKNSFKFSLIQTMSLVLANQSVTRAPQLRLPLQAPATPHKKLTLLKGIKRKTMLLSMSLMNISSLHEKILTHVSLLIGGEVAVHSFLNYIGL